MCSANGAPTPGLFAQLADDAVQSVALGLAQTLGRIQQIPNFGAIPVHGRRATSGPFILTTFLCTLQQLISTTGLIQSLQHSILGVWLALTQAGFTPASQSDLASPHVHRLVIRKLGFRGVHSISTRRGEAIPLQLAGSLNPLPARWY
jgi:hypothetical protein